MEPEKVEKQFAQGVFIKMPPDAAPNFILLNMSFKPHEFFTWCQDRMDEKGWVNIQVKKSQKGTIYAELDTWKPTTTPEQAQAAKDYNDSKYTDKDRQNVKEAAQVGMTLSDEDLAAMQDMPF